MAKVLDAEFDVVSWGAAKRPRPWCLRLLAWCVQTVLVSLLMGAVVFVVFAAGWFLLGIHNRLPTVIVSALVLTGIGALIRRFAAH